MVSVGICAIARNEARYIREWIAFHLVQGVSSIVVYDNDSTDGTADLIRAADVRDRLSVMPWSLPGVRFDKVQRCAYMDGAARLAGRVEFVVFIDIDEFVYARPDVGLPSAFARFGLDVGAVALNQRVFGSAGRKRLDAAPVTSRFTYCTVLNHPEGQWFKTAGRPELIQDFDSVHSVLLRSGRYVMSDGGDLVRETEHPGFADRIAHGGIGLNHYMLKSLEEFRLKQERWRLSDLSWRYNNDYFDERDIFANKARMPLLKKFRHRVDSAVGQLWPPGTAWAAGEARKTAPYLFGWRHSIRRQLARISHTNWVHRASE